VTATRGRTSRGLPTRLPQLRRAALCAYAISDNLEAPHQMLSTTVRDGTHGRGCGNHDIGEPVEKILVRPALALAGVQPSNSK
jgi:hypothetical protein